MSKMYRVVWEIDIEAGNPVQAAKCARAIQQDPENTATFFTVREVSATGYPMFPEIEVELDPEQKAEKEEVRG